MKKLPTLNPPSGKNEYIVYVCVLNPATMESKDQLYGNIIFLAHFSTREKANEYAIQTIRETGIHNICVAKSCMWHDLKVYDKNVVQVPPSGEDSIAKLESAYQSPREEGKTPGDSCPKEILLRECYNAVRSKQALDKRINRIKSIMSKDPKQTWEKEVVQQLQKEGVCDADILCENIKRLVHT